MPEGAEPTEQFHARCAETLLKLFEYMIRMDVTEAACVTHGGVIMSMLSQRATLCPLATPIPCAGRQKPRKTRHLSKNLCRAALKISKTRKIAEEQVKFRANLLTESPEFTIV